MKKLFSFVLAFFIAFSCCITAFAKVDLSKVSGFVDKSISLSGSSFTFDLSSLFEFCYNIYESLVSSYAKKIETYRTTFFIFMLSNGLSVSFPILNNNEFSEEYINAYFDFYWDTCTKNPYWTDSSFDIYLQAAGYTDEHFSTIWMGFFSQNEGIYTGNQIGLLKEATRKDFINYYKVLLARFLLSQGETVTDPNPGKSGLEIAPAYVGSDEFIEGLEIDNTLYFPRNDYRVVSYRNDPTFQRLVKDGKAMSNQIYEPTIIYEGGYLVNKNSPALYFVLFYYDDDIKGYGMYQYKFYIADEVNEDGSIKKVPHLMRWNCFDESEAEAVEVDFSVQNGMPNFSETCTFKYVRLGFDSSTLIFKCYDTYDAFMNNSSSYCFFKASSGYQEYFKCYNTDLSSIFGFYQYGYANRNHLFLGSLDKHAESCTFNSDDLGLITSTEPILLKSYPFDSSKIGKGQIVTINGDNIYNYTITNPETGDSSKFGDYITNNYSYITNNYGGDSSGAGGKVEVGGKIDVGGSVGVDITVSVPDININVKGSGGEGTSLSPSDFTSGDTVDTKKYFDSALEMSENTQNFFGDIFSFLPPEILALILFGLTMAIVCRVGGR